MAKEFTIPHLLQPWVTPESLVLRSPGRINLIGEHTDYNNGYVLPAAIDKAVYLVATPRKDKEIHLQALDLKDQYTGNLESLVPSGQSWPNYILGVVQQFKQVGVVMQGFDLALTSDIPIGAGLSSSAAVECATAMALNEMFGAGFSKLELVKFSQKAENTFVGVQCGIMDQFASMFGKPEQVIQLDCRSLHYEYVPFQLAGYKIVLLDTNVKHSLASTAYNERRQQCEAGVALIQSAFPMVQSLRDVSIAMLDQCVKPKDALIYQRCKYVVEENERLQQACVDLRTGHWQDFGKRLYAAHEGLSKMYAVSCKELDFLVTQVSGNPAVLGARMMGGGFGGCTINLVKETAVSTLIETTATAYRLAMHKDLTAHIATIGEGTSLLKK